MAFHLSVESIEERCAKIDRARVFTTVKKLMCGLEF